MPPGNALIHNGFRRFLNTCTIEFTHEMTIEMVSNRVVCCWFYKVAGKALNFHTNRNIYENSSLKTVTDRSGTSADLHLSQT